LAFCLPVTIPTASSSPMVHTHHIPLKNHRKGTRAHSQNLNSNSNPLLSHIDRGAQGYLRSWTLNRFNPPMGLSLQSSSSITWWAPGIFASKIVFDSGDSSLLATLSWVLLTLGFH
jgi:hypothetical protein